MKWPIRILVVLVCLIGGFLAMPVWKIGSGDTVSKKIHFVALGDSIAHGYGLTNPEKDSYVGKVAAYLETEYDYVSTVNLGTNGLQSEELLTILTDKENENYSKYRENIKYADMITLSIGSNDLLHLIRLDMDMQEYIENDGKIFRDACQKFKNTFPKIICELKKISPKADIYVNNIYNPCHGLEKYKDLFSLAEYYINLINQTYQNGMNFKLVDVKKEFDKSSQKLVNMAFKGSEIDPHPSKEGYALIGQTVIRRLKSEN